MSNRSNSTNKNSGKIQGKAATPPTGRRLVTLDANEYESVVDQLKAAVHITIDAWVTRDEMADGLELILERFHAIRLNLECAHHIANSEVVS